MAPPKVAVQPPPATTRRSSTSSKKRVQDQPRKSFAHPHPRQQPQEQQQHHNPRQELQRSSSLRALESAKKNQEAVLRSLREPDPRKTLELHIISAQRLPKVHFMTKTRAYATAWVDSMAECKLTTGVDVRGGRNPSWNDIFRFEVDAEEVVKRLGSNAGVTIEIASRGWLGRRKLIGSVRVLLTDLLEAIRVSKGKCFSFMVIRPSGKRQGVLNLGVRPRYVDDERSRELCVPPNRKS